MPWGEGARSSSFKCLVTATYPHPRLVIGHALVLLLFTMEYVSYSILPTSVQVSKPVLRPYFFTSFLLNTSTHRIHPVVRITDLRCNKKKSHQQRTDAQVTAKRGQSNTSGGSITQSLPYCKQPSFMLLLFVPCDPLFFFEAGFVYSSV